jgi:hypothetical protein
MLANGDTKVSSSPMIIQTFSENKALAFLMFLLIVAHMEFLLEGLSFTVFCNVVTLQYSILSFIIFDNLIA